MKTLFVCRGNIGRSQMAKSFYNALHPSHPSESCGTVVFENEGQIIADVPDDGVEKDIQAMREVGLDISQYHRKQITGELVEAADRVVVMAERKTWPHFLENNPKVIVWDINNPKDASLHEVKDIRDKIRDKVLLLDLT